MGEIDLILVGYILLGNLALDVALVPVLMVLYIVYTGIIRVREESTEPMPKFLVLLVSGALWTAGKVDVYINYSLGTKLFLALPPWKKVTLSQRMSYYWDNLPDTSRRRKLVVWIVNNTWINKFDPSGQHIGNRP